MPIAARITLLFVVFVDLIGQGLVFPIVNGLIMEPDADFLPPGTSDAVRHFDFGLVIGIFFLAWFLGVVYVSRLSDAIGRKNALLICLGGAAVGYLVSILALALDSLWLLVLGRAITGLTAGNQPIAQAAMIDASADPAERDRNMGYIVTGVSFGLVGGPIIGGILSDKGLMGGLASYSLPLWAALALVGLAIAMVLAFFTDIRTERREFVFRPRDVIDSLAQIASHPLVMKLMPVYAFFMIANVTFYIFIDNYLTSAFGYGVAGSSAVMMVIGVAVAISGTWLVGPAQQRFTRRRILGVTLAVMVPCVLGFRVPAGGGADLHSGFRVLSVLRRHLSDLAWHFFRQCRRGRSGLGDGHHHGGFLSRGRYHVADRRRPDEPRHPPAFLHRGGSRRPGVAVLRMGLEQAGDTQADRAGGVVAAGVWRGIVSAGT